MSIIWVKSPKTKFRDLLVPQKYSSILGCPKVKGSSLKNGSSSGGASCSQLHFRHFGPLFSLLQLLLGFPELGQVEGGDLLSLLDLLLVGLER